MRERARYVFKDLIYIIALFALTIIFFEEMIFHDRLLLLRDLFCDFLPWREFARESIRNGIAPLWNPYSSLGQPFIAFPQTAVFYPLNSIFYIFPQAAALRYFIILHIFLAGVFMYLLMKHWQVSRVAAFVSAIIFMFNGVIISKLEFLSFISAIIWCPLIFCLLDKAIKKRSLLYAILTGIVLAIQLLAGHTQTFYYTSLAIGFYWITNVIMFAFNTKNIREALKAFFILPLASIIALSLSMIQLLPSIELTNLSIRGASYDPQWNFASLPPFHFLTFLAPYLFGVPGYANQFWGTTLGEFWAGSFYIGIFPLLLSFISLTPHFYKKAQMPLCCSSPNNLSDFRRLTIFFASLALFSMALASGKYTPVYELFYNYFPFFNRFRWPSKLMEQAIFSLSIIAGIGCHYLCITLQDLKNRHIKETGSYLFLIFKILTITDLILVALFLSCYLMTTKILPLLTGYIDIIHIKTIPISLEARYHQIMKGYLTMLIFLNAGLAILFLGIIRKIGYKTIKALMPLIIILDLFFQFKGLNYYSREDIYDIRPDVINHLESDKDLFRVGPSSHLALAQQFLYGIKEDSSFLWAKSALVGETSLPYRIPKIGGGGELKINYYTEFMEFLSKRFPPLGATDDIVKLLNIKYVLQAQDFKDVLFNKASKRVQIARINNFQPRVFVVGRVLVLNDKADILNRLFSEGFDLLNEIIIEPQEGADSHLPIMDHADKIGHIIKKIDYSQNEVDIDIELDSNGFMVLSDTYYQGWKAYVDGKETEIYKTDYILRSIYLEKGSHDVKFIYKPASFKIGCIITISTASVLAISGIFIAIRYLWGKKPVEG